MYLGRFFLFFTIYCGIIVFCKMVKGAEKDIYDPSYVLKKNTSIKARKVIYFIVIFFSYTLLVFILFSIFLD